MREGMFILPLQDNDGVDLSALVHDTWERLSAVFGGVTAIQGVGIWDGQKEDVWTLTAAYDPTEANHRIFERIARDAAQGARQNALYLRYADGEVKIIDLDSLPVAARA